MDVVGIDHSIADLTEVKSLPTAAKTPAGSLPRITGKEATGIVLRR